MKLLRAVVCCAMGAALTSCTEPQAQESDPVAALGVATAVDGRVKLLTAESVPGSARNFGHFEDRLSLNRKGCFAFASDGASIVVPDTWTVGQRGESLVSPDGWALHLGEGFAAGGGYATWTRDTVPREFRPCPGDWSRGDGTSPYSRIVTLYDIRPIGG
jgi:hypothetical protein